MSNVIDIKSFTKTKQKEINNNKVITKTKHNTDVAHKVLNELVMGMLEAGHDSNDIETEYVLKRVLYIIELYRAVLKGLDGETHPFQPHLDICIEMWDVKGLFNDIS